MHRLSLFEFQLFEMMSMVQGCDSSRYLVNPNSSTLIYPLIMHIFSSDPEFLLLMQQPYPSCLSWTRARRVG